MSNEEHRGAVRLPEAQHFILHVHASEGIQGTKWFIQKENLRMVNECAGQGDSLRHTAGKMVWVGVGEFLEAYKAHEFVDLRTLLAKYAARDQAGLDIASDRKPRKEIGVLKNQSALRARAGDRFGADGEFARAWSEETSDEAQKGGLAATAGAHDRDKFSYRQRERDIIQSQRSNTDAVSRGEMLAHMSHAQRRGFASDRIRGDGYHLMTPFCQTSTRSRTLKSTVMIVEKNAAMITKAP